MRETNVCECGVRGGRNHSSDFSVERASEDSILSPSPSSPSLS